MFFYMFVCFYVHLVSFITVLIEFVCLSMCFSSFISFFHYYKSIERKPQFVFSFFIFAAINLMFLIISMVSSNSLFIFIFLAFLIMLFIIIFWIILLLFPIPKYPNYLGGGRVWWVIVIFCAYPHTINFRVYFSKLSSIGVSVFMGFMVLLSLVSHRLVQLFKSPISLI